MPPARTKPQGPRLAPGAQVGPYRIVGSIGAGGMGEVFRARDERLKRDVAIKVLPQAFAADPDRLRRFADEARAAGGLNHPGILAVHDMGEHEGVPYLVTELLEGQSLRERLLAGKVPPRKAIDMGAQVAQALAAAHDKGIVHRDLKPENLFVLGDGRVKILDFGLAKALADDDIEEVGDIDAGGPTAVAKTQPGAVLGTPGYMAPEQARGSGQIDARADIFSFGAVLYEVLSGQPAFPGDSPVERSFAVLRNDPPALPERTPPALDLVVRRCLEKNPGERFQSARDLAFSLQALSNTSATGAVPVLARAQARRWPILAAGAAVLLGVGALAFVGGRLSAPRVAPATQPEFQRLVYRHGVVGRARFSPDRRSVVFGAELDGDAPQVYETTPGQGRARSISGPGVGLWDVSSLGELALSVRRRVLARAPLAGGQPRELLENVVDASWTPDGTAMAVLHGRGRLEMPAGQLVYESLGSLDSVRVSPDGKQLAFIERPTAGETRGRVMVVGADRKARPLGPEWPSIDGLAWGPGGRELWTSAGDAGWLRALQAVSPTGQTRILLRLPGVVGLQDVVADGRALIVATSVHQHIVGFGPEQGDRDLATSDSDILAGLTPDGSKLLLVEGASGPDRRTTLRPTDGGPPVEIATGRGWALSQDGKQVLVSPLAPWGQVVLVPTGPGETRPQQAGPIVEYSGAAFTSDANRFVVVGRAEGKKVRLWIQKAGEPPAPIGDEGMQWTSPVAPDDSYVVARAASGKLVRVPLDGGPVTELAGLQPWRTTVTGFSADGKSLFTVRRLDEGGVTLERYDLDTQKVTTQTDLETVLANRPVTNAIVSRDGKHGVALVSETGTELYLVSGLK